MIKFGTDGIRGPAGIAPLDSHHLERLGCSIALSLNHSDKVLIGRDTRKSGQWIQEALAKGLTEGGVDVFCAGIIPTGALSVAVAKSDYALGIMITASHNPAADNGVKILSSTGHKPTKSQQAALLAQFNQTSTRSKGQVHILSKEESLKPWLEALPKPDLSGLKIILDCAHGAAAPHVPQILRQLGAEVEEIACTAEGSKINLNCGALHPPQDIGHSTLAICFDGDADRLVMVDQNGIIDGDDMLWIMSGHISGPLIGTIMSNGGLEEKLKTRLKRSAVGDSHVAALMNVENAPMGAEPSGHVLFSDGLPTGDGLYTALRILSAAIPPFDRSWSRWPCEQASIRYTKEKVPVQEFFAPDQARSAGQRVIVRYSGTEPKLRILVEGPDAAVWLQNIVHEAESKLL